MPNVNGQLVAQDFSKYAEFVAEQRDPGQWRGHARSRTRTQYPRAVAQNCFTTSKHLLRKSRVQVPGQCELEISHHYGLDKFREFGLTAITVINREYCKRLMVVLPGQKHPEQWHEVKDETYHVLYGEVTVDLDGHQTLTNPTALSPSPTASGIRFGRKAAR